MVLDSDFFTEFCNIILTLIFLLVGNNTVKICWKKMHFDLELNLSF